MTKPQTLTSQILLTVDGTQVQSPEIESLVEVVVDQHSHLPDTFSIRLHDPELKFIDSGLFDLTKAVKIEAEKPDGSKVTLVEGEITALEPDFGEGMISTLLVRGYDKSHRMYREPKSVAHLNKKDSDLASDIARAHGLKAQVDHTSTVYDHIYQNNMSDLSFLTQRAWRIGYECFVSEGTLYFRKPPAEAASLKLTWGEDLISFRPSLNLAEQVDEVVVKGWDVEKQAPIVGRAQKGTLSPKTGEKKDGGAWAKQFDTGKYVIVDQPVINQAEADILAAARFNEISGAFGAAEGVAQRRPDLQAGRSVELKGLGNRCSGTYLVTRATHIYSTGGLKTLIHVLGARTGTLIGELTADTPISRWPGVVVGIVTNTEDPKDWGRVKVKYPWMAEDAESDWARLATIGGGPDAGLAAIPDVGDEVVLAFEHGDFSRPFVLGGLWNGQHKLPAETEAPAGKEALVRVWCSRTGHFIAMHDTSDKKLQIKTAGGYSITLDDRNKNISISGPGQLEINMNDEITIEGKANIKIKAAGDLNLEATKNVTIKGTEVTVEGMARATMKATNVAVQGSATTEIKGGMVRIN